MTMFEEFANELGVEIKTDKNGFYTGITSALVAMTNEVILSDNEMIRNLDWEEQKKLITKKFYKTFPYMK